MIIIFSSLEIAEVLIREIAATPFGMVWFFYDPDNQGWDETVTDDKGVQTIVHHDAANIVQQSHAKDGRVGIAYQFSVDDEAWLRAYLADEDVIFTTTWPANWEG